MTSKRRLLETLVILHDREGCPLGADRLAERLGAEAAEIRERLESLRSYELVKRSGDGPGYVPTITGRELLELDIDGEFLVVDPPANGDVTTDGEEIE